MDAAIVSSASPRSLGARAAISLVALAGLTQLGALYLSVPIGNALDVSKTLLDYCLHSPIANVATLAILWWFLRRRGEPINAETFGLKPLRWSAPDSKQRARVGAVVAVGMLLLSISPIGQWTIERLWDLVPGPEWALGTPESYKGDFPLDVTPALIAFQLLVRIPLTVFTEELLFRGYLQPRLGRWAPVTVGVLFACYHLGQWWTILELIPFGIALGVLRWWTGSLIPGAAAHYAGNAVYLLSAV